MSLVDLAVDLGDSLDGKLVHEWLLLLVLVQRVAQLAHSKMPLLVQRYNSVYAGGSEQNRESLLKTTA